MKALVRKREGSVAEAMPPAVEVVVGDIGDMTACKAAVEGVQKVPLRKSPCLCALRWHILLDVAESTVARGRMLRCRESQNAPLILLSIQARP